MKNVDVQGKEVELESGEKVGWEFLAIATGVRQGGPAMVGGVEKEDGRKALRGLQERIEASNRVAVVGGGAVGVQLVGDVKSWFPEKEVTLVQSRERLLPGFGERLGVFVEEKLTAMGVRVLCGERPVLPAEYGAEKVTTLVFRDGSCEDFDLVVSVPSDRPRKELTCMPSYHVQDKHQTPASSAI